MSLKTIGLVLFSVFLATAGQLTLKTGMARVGYLGTERLSQPFQLLLQVARTWQVIVGLVLFVVSAVSWLIVLSRVPLSFAYPFVGITYVLLPLFGRFVLKEHVPAMRWFGVFLIVAGVVLVGTTTPPEPASDAAASRAASSAH
ncbi:MAG TPA: EamA family transporter [Actinomycetota bacterium]|nr:EamA family transporter [Actinomycetota bacterium]